ncbi:MAG: pyridoxamine 5'-phosphate oxidase [Bdellovibrionia bacterium]
MFNFQQDPYLNFKFLIDSATQKGVAEPTAMSLSTVDKNLNPSVRVVYCKQHSPEGFIFYTNYNGAKSQDINIHPQVCINFYWADLWQQIRINGKAQKVDRATSEKYFATRARLSQLGAWASDQSEVLNKREDFFARLKKYEEQFADQEVPCPPHWGGFLIVPERYEFWFGTEGRLHERYVYERPTPSAAWTRHMLNP